MQRIIWLADLETLAQTPSQLAALRDRLGISTVWLESHLFHTAGFALSPSTWESSPFKDWRSRPGLPRHRAVHHLPDEAYPVLPGILAGVDDTALLRLLDTAHQAGIEVWGHLGLWSYGGMIYPEYSLRGLHGELMNAAEDRWGSGFCPNQPVINAWLAGCLEDCITRYPLDGIEVDHARFLPPASLPNLLTCACPNCAASAAEAGENLPALAAVLAESLQRARRLSARQVLQRLSDSGSLVEALDALALDQAASTWLAIRSRSISQNLNRLAARARLAARPGFVFGADLFPPSVARLGGHSYNDLTGLDFQTGGYGLIGWEKTALDTCAAWADALLLRWPELDEAALSGELVRLAGLEAPRQPGPLLLAQTEASEIRHLAAARPANRPFYPPVNLAALGVDGAGRVIQCAAENGFEGVALANLDHLTQAQLVQLGSLLNRQN